MYAGTKKVFEQDPNPKNSPEGPEKSKKAQNLAELKTKDRAVLPKRILIVCISKFQKGF